MNRTGSGHISLKLVEALGGAVGWGGIRIGAVLPARLSAEEPGADHDALGVGLEVTAFGRAAVEVLDLDVRPGDPHKSGGTRVVHQ